MIDRPLRPEGPEDLGDRLATMRTELLLELAASDILSPGFLALLANVTTAIEAVEQMPVEAKPAAMRTAAAALPPRLRS
jgi:hypothetical protein